MSRILARWYAIPCGLCVLRARSGCPSGSPRVSFVCVCALALSRSPRPPPPRVGVARAPSAVPVLGAGRAIPHGLCPSACPASVLCSFWLALTGGGGARFVSPLPGLGPCAPLGAGLRVWGVLTPRAGGGGGLRAIPPGGAVGGSCRAGNRLSSVRPSAFPGQATKRVSLTSLWPWRAWPPYFSSSCSHAVTGRGPCGVPLLWPGFACPSRFLREQAAGGVAAGPLPRPPPPGRCGPSGGEGGPSPLPWAWMGAGAAVARGSEGGSGRTGGGSCRGSPPPSSREGGLWPPAQTPLCPLVGPNFSHHKARVQAVGWSPLGTRKQGSRPFAAPFPPQQKWGPKQAQHSPPPQHALAPPHPHCRPSHGDQGPSPHGQGADAERWVCCDLGPAW